MKHTQKWMVVPYSENNPRKGVESDLSNVLSKKLNPDTKVKQYNQVLAKNIQSNHPVIPENPDSEYEEEEYDSPSPSNHQSFVDDVEMIESPKRKRKRAEVSFINNSITKKEYKPGEYQISTRNRHHLDKQGIPWLPYGANNEYQNKIKPNKPTHRGQAPY